MNKRIIFTSLILVSMIFWGVNWTAGKILTDFASPRVLAFWRYAITLLFLLPLFAADKRKKEKRETARMKDRLLLVLSGVLLALFNLLFFEGLKKGSASVGGIFFNTFNPVLTMGASVVLLKKKIAPAKIAGIIIGLSGGIVLIAARGDSAADLLRNGNLYFLCAAFCWSAITLLSRHVQKSISFYSYSFYVYLFAALIHLFIAAPEGLNIFTIENPGFWLILGFTSIGATAFSNTVFFYATSKLSAYHASSYMFIIPISAFAAAALLLGESMGSAEYLGGGLSLAALLLISLKRPEALKEENFNKFHIAMKR